MLEMKGAEQFIYLLLEVGVGMNLTLIPVNTSRRSYIQFLTHVHQHDSGPSATP